MYSGNFLSSAITVSMIVLNLFHYLIFLHYRLFSIGWGHNFLIYQSILRISISSVDENFVCIRKPIGMLLKNYQLFLEVCWLLKAKQSS